MGGEKTEWIEIYVEVDETNKYEMKYEGQYRGLMDKQNF